MFVGMTTIRATMEKVIDMPMTFLLVTVLVFCAVIAIIGVIIYVVACAKSKQTEMTGIMRVGVELNTWLDDSQCKGMTALKYGDFWISMIDPAAGTGNRLNGKLNWKEKALYRQYPVSIFLERFLAAYKSAGLIEDPSAKLLESLLKQERFCKALGKCSYVAQLWEGLLEQKSFGRALGKLKFIKNRMGLSVTDSFAYKKEPDKKNKISVYCKIDGGTFRAETGCDAETICVTLEYQR